jgi:stalled ribosome rescue protein Dom34
MDYSKAHLMEILPGDMKTQTIESAFTHEAKAETRDKGEKHMHNKEDGDHLKYFKKIQIEIEKFDDVLIFGPTEAKVELYDLLKENHKCEGIRIEIQTSDKMTENQLHAYVRNHFIESKHLN